MGDDHVMGQVQAVEHAVFGLIRIIFDREDQTALATGISARQGDPVARECRAKVGYAPGKNTNLRKRIGRNLRARADSFEEA